MMRVRPCMIVKMIFINHGKLWKGLHSIAEIGHSTLE